jgi:hypothetical protein
MKAAREEGIESLAEMIRSWRRDYMELEKR